MNCPVVYPWPELWEMLVQVDRKHGPTLMRPLPVKLRKQIWGIDFFGAPQGNLFENINVMSSGSTGNPVHSCFSVEKLQAEVSMLERLIQPGFGGSIVSFAPVNHLYALVCGVMLANYLNVRFWYVPHLYGFAAISKHDRDIGTVLTLPATWVALHRDSAFEANANSIKAIHSAGPLPDSVEGILNQNPAFRLFEIFGSTETGAIAWRQDRPKNGYWNFFDDVQSANQGKDAQTLRVKSRRSSITSFHATGDIIQPVSSTQFKFLGRSHQLIKVNGKKLFLDSVQAALYGQFPNCPNSVEIIRHQIRGESYRLHLQTANLEPESRKRLEQDVSNYICDKFGSDALPSAIVSDQILEKPYAAKLDNQ